MTTESHLLLKPLELNGVPHFAGQTVELTTHQAEWCRAQGIIAPAAFAPREVMPAPADESLSANPEGDLS